MVSYWLILVVHDILAVAVAVGMFSNYEVVILYGALFVTDLMMSWPECKQYRVQQCSPIVKRFVIYLPFLFLFFSKTYPKIEVLNCQIR